MVTIVKVKKDVMNYILRFFVQREKDAYNYALLYSILDDVQKYIDEKMVEVGQQLIDQSFDKPIYVKENKKYVLPIDITDTIQTIRVEEQSQFNKLADIQ